MSFLSISYIVYCQLDQGANFVLQKAQYDAAGKLPVCKEFFNCVFSNYKITPSSSRGENKINKVIILDTKKIKNIPNAGKSGQGVVHVSQNSVQK